MAIVIEKAQAKDFGPIVRLLKSHGLPEAGLGEHMTTAVVARSEGDVVGSAVVEIYPKGALLRSLAVDRRLQGHGLGKRLTKAAIELARSSGAPAAYLLTTTAETFFPRLGFDRIERDEVPEDVRRSVEFTSACPASAVAMMKILR